MAKEDILLRVTVNPPLFTKGSTLTQPELDSDFVSIFNCFVELSQSSYINNYDNTFTYDQTINNYTVFNSQIWKFINVSDMAGVTPGTDATVWEKVYGSDLAHKQGQDTVLDEGGPNEITASDITNLLTSFNLLSQTQVVTAHAGGGEVNAFLLTRYHSLINVAATDNDSVKLASPVAGKKFKIRNKSGKIVDIYANGGMFEGLSIGDPYLLDDGIEVEFVCFINGTYQ